METAKNLLWCAAFSIVVCAVVVGLLVLGAWLDETAISGKQAKKERITTCEPSGKGFYKCETTYF